MENNVYQTKDLYEAATLYSLGKIFLGLKQDNGFYWFQFGDLEGCEQIADDFWGKRISVNAKGYSEALRTLKDRIFSRSS